jgi:N-acetylneuraminic acid mutarotase
VYKYDDNKVWVPMGTIPEPATTEGALVSLGERLYLIGGSNADGNASTQVHVADPVESTINWDQPTPPPQRTIARKLFDAVSDGSRIWVVGGWDGSHALSTVETFEPNDGWKLSTPLPVAVVDARAIFSGGKIFVFGGWNGGSHFNDALGLVQVIDTKTGRTSIIGRTPDYLSGQVPVALNDGRAFLFGAFEFGISGITEHPEVYSFTVPSP